MVKPLLMSLPLTLLLGSNYDHRHHLQRLANYETWLVHLWLSNDQSTDEAMREYCSGTTFEWDSIKDYAAELLGCPESGFAADACNATLAKVDWREILKAFSEQ